MDEGLKIIIKSEMQTITSSNSDHNALNPITPEIWIQSQDDAHAPATEQFVVSQHACVMRCLTPVLDINLGLFSSMSLVLANPEHKVEIRTQCQQASNENYDETGRRVWQCASNRSRTTIAKYAEYQVSLYSEMRNETAQQQASEMNNENCAQDSECVKRRRMIKFGTNVDLSDKQKWRRQLQELKKLPQYTQVMSGRNMLSYVGHTILGVNSVQLYMKVPGSRTPGHQENSNFCSVNINVGPGDCEWFCVPEEYWKTMEDICTAKEIDYLTGSWWPDPVDLYQNNIPLYHFIQKPGDLVWIGPGTVHWVQAIGWCNTIAWNVGPLTHLQYQVAIERHDYYKLHHFRSIIPMIQLSWNLARKQIVMTDSRFVTLLRTFLGQSLNHCTAALRCAAHLDKEVKWHERVDGELAHYCECCEGEVFNILFTISSHDKKTYFVHCIDCALAASPTLDKVIVLQQYDMTDLTKVYDSLKT